MAGGWGGKRPGAGAKPKSERIKRAVVAAATGTDLVAAQPKQKAFSFIQNIGAVERVIEQSERYARRKTIRPEELNPFRLPAFPPNVIPKQKAHRMALDEAVSWGAAQWSGGVLAGVASEGLLFLGYPYLSELAQRPEYRIFSETISTEMTRKWIKFSGTGDEDKTDKIKELVDFLDALQVRDRYADIALQDGFFGRAHLFHDFGADIDDTRGELASPIGNGRNEFSKSKISPKTPLKRLKVIEPVWTYPTTYNATNPLAIDWYDPQVWYVMGKQIHASRLLKFIGHAVPDMLKPAYAFGGLSLSQMAKPYVDIWLRTRQSVADIVHSFSVMVLETDLTTILQPGNAGGLIARAAMFNALRDNQGLMIVNKDTEGFQNVSAPLGSLDKLQAQAQEHMAAVARIPLVKFTGISPAGLNASSEGEMRAFYDTIGAYQNRFFRPNLTITIDFAMLSLWGEVDQEITYEFEPLWEMTEKEKGEKKKAEAETGQIHIDGGVISPAEERQRIINDPDSAYQGLDPEDVPDLAAEEEQGLEPEGGRPDPKAEGEPEGEGGKPAAKPAKKEGVAEDSVLPFDLAYDASWNETDHPRAPDGKFGSGSGGGSSGGESEGGGIMTASVFMALLNKPAIAGGNYRRALMKAIKQAGDSPHAKTLTGKLIESWSKTYANAVKKGEHDKADKIAKKIKSLGGKLDHPLATEPGKPFEGTKVEKPAAPKKTKTVELPSGQKVEIEELEPAKKPEPVAPKFPAPTENELAKAKKNVALQLQYVPGNEAIKTPAGKGEAQKLVDAFNEKYAGKELSDQPALIQKVNDFKMMAAKMTAITATEAVKAQEWAAQQKIEAAKKAKEQKAKEQAAAAEVAEKNKAVMQELGISDAEAYGFNALVKMMGGSQADVISSFKKYEYEAKQYGYPITGFQTALIKNYTDGGYGHINSALRKGSWSAAQHVYVKMVNKALQSMPTFEGVTKRGATLSSADQALYVAGNVVEERAFTSTSPSKPWSGNTQFTINAKGKRGASVKKLSSHGHEDEVVFSARTFFHVDKVENKGGVMHVHMTETDAD